MLEISVLNDIQSDCDKNLGGLSGLWAIEQEFITSVVSDNMLITAINLEADTAFHFFEFNNQDANVSEQEVESDNGSFYRLRTNVAIYKDNIDKRRVFGGMRNRLFAILWIDSNNEYRFQQNVSSLIQHATGNIGGENKFDIRLQKESKELAYAVTGFVNGLEVSAYTESRYLVEKEYTLL